MSQRMNLQNQIKRKKMQDISSQQKRVAQHQLTGTTSPFIRAL